MLGCHVRYEKTEDLHWRASRETICRLTDLGNELVILHSHCRENLKSHMIIGLLLDNEHKFANYMLWAF
jgi:uncharacterized protein YihD (DUF1040 family)